MRDADLFQLALGLTSRWKVTRFGFSSDEVQLDLYVEFPAGSRFACAQCGREDCGVHDTQNETGVIWASSDIARSCMRARRG
jgi:hypothetical protein